MNRIDQIGRLEITADVDGTDYSRGFAAGYKAQEPMVLELLKALEISANMLEQCMKHSAFTLGAVKNVRIIKETIAKAKGEPA